MIKVNKLMLMLPLLAALTPITSFAEANPPQIGTGTISASKENVTYSEDIVQSEDENASEVQVYVSQPSTYSVFIPKIITLNGTKGEENDADYVVKVNGNIATDLTVNVIPPSTFQMVESDGLKDSITASITQPVTKFVNEDAKTKRYADNEDTIMIKDNNENNIGIASGNVKVDNLSAGIWGGTFNFAIILNQLH